MNMPYIMGLRADVWSQSSLGERQEALQELENYFAMEEGREPAQVSSVDMPSSALGKHYFDDRGVDNIELNSNLLQGTTPYESVETLCHESRHSYQHHIVENPELATSQDQVEDWQKSQSGGYIQPNEINYSTYRWQSTEIDANEMARERTDQLYQGVFQDTDQYPEYKAKQEQLLNDDIEYAKYELGENYVEEANKAVSEKYESAQTETSGESEGYDYGYSYY